VGGKSSSARVVVYSHCACDNRDILFYSRLHRMGFGGVIVKIGLSISNRRASVYVPGFHPILTIKLFVRGLHAARSHVTLEQFAEAGRKAGYKVTIKKIPPKA
jgi:hypothetical protein